MNQNKATAIELSKAIMAGDWTRVDALLAPDFTYVGDGRPMDRAGYLHFMRDVLCKAMTDMQMEFPRVVAEGDLVAAEYTNEMTHAGAIFGVEATGRRVVASGQFIRQIRNGQVAAEWQTTNAAGLMRQLQGG